MFAEICGKNAQNRKKVTAELSMKMFFKIYKKRTASLNETMQHFVIFLREK